MYVVSLFHSRHGSVKHRQQVYPTLRSVIKNASYPKFDQRPQASRPHTLLAQPASVFALPFVPPFASLRKATTTAMARRAMRGACCTAHDSMLLYPSMALQSCPISTADLIFPSLPKVPRSPVLLSSFRNSAITSHDTPDLLFHDRLDIGTSLRLSKCQRQA